MIPERTHCWETAEIFVEEPVQRLIGDNASRATGARDRLCVVVVQESRSPDTPIGHQLDPGAKKAYLKGVSPPGPQLNPTPSDREDLFQKIALELGTVSRHGGCFLGLQSHRTPCTMGTTGT